MGTALIIVSILAAGAFGAAVWFYAQSRSSCRERDALRSELDDLQRINEAHLQKLEAMGSEASDLKSQLARVEEREKAARDEAARALAQAKETFATLAGKTLQQTMDEFNKRAELFFTKEADPKLEANRVAIENLVKPVRETLEKYNARLGEVEKARTEGYTALKTQVAALQFDQTRLRDETANLVKALRRPEVRGQWGELQMERLFELAGMTEHVDYDEQAKTESADGPSLRPDFTVHLPNDRVVVVDVKTPFDAYLDATEATDDEEREQLLARHARQVKSAVENLAGKAYWSRCKGSPEFVVMFVPGESMLYAAVQRDPNLIENAMSKNVIIATPTVVMALLKTVHLGWREKSQAENAQRIADLGRELHDRLVKVVADIVTLGKRLDGAVKQYNTVIGSVDARLIPAARKFEDLKADSSRPLPETIEPMEIQIRESQSLLGSREET